MPIIGWLRRFVFVHEYSSVYVFLITDDLLNSFESTVFGGFDALSAAFCEIDITSIGVDLKETICKGVREGFAYDGALFRIHEKTLTSYLCISITCLIILVQFSNTLIERGRAHRVSLW